ncbi:MAG: NAD(P)-dependent oxidoreductase, partial [Natronospirillum sp.]
MVRKTHNETPPTPQAKPIVLITGAAGGIGTALTRALRPAYEVIAVDQRRTDAADASYEFDLTSADSVNSALKEIADQHGRDIAAVVHLAAYFDFTGAASPLYNKVNVEGTEHLLAALREFSVDRFIYSSTMLVHQPSS